MTLRRNFCNRPRNRKLFRFQRSVSGICNNLSPGYGTAGAADTPVARLIGRGLKVLEGIYRYPK